MMKAVTCGSLVYAKVVARSVAPTASGEHTPAVVVQKAAGLIGAESSRAALPVPPGRRKASAPTGRALWSVADDSVCGGYGEGLLDKGVLPTPI
jgi:hypothetical protein